MTQCALPCSTVCLRGCWMQECSMHNCSLASVALLTCGTLPISSLLTGYYCAYLCLEGVGNIMQSDISGCREEVLAGNYLR